MRKTPVYNHRPIELKRLNVRSFMWTDEGANNVRPGDFYWIVDEDSDTYDIVIALPCTHSYYNYKFSWIYSRWPVNAPGENHKRRWDWDGEKDKPTLTPSLHMLEYWHGFLIKGRLIEHR